MKTTQKWMVLAMAIGLFAACKKETASIDPAAKDAPGSVAANSNDDDDEWNTGHVYTLSNEVSGNRVMDYTRSATGQLTFSAAYASGGNGTGGGLGNQGAVVLANNNNGEEDDDNVLLAVNAGSNSVSSFKINRNGLRIRSTVNSGGMRPVSIAQYGNLVYVLNAGGDGNISGFYLNGSRLYPIANSTKPLSSTASGAAQVSFTNYGRVLVVTEKATNKIITYTVNNNGTPGMMHSITSASATPFGFAVGRNGQIFVSEAVGGAANASNVSSYKVQGNGEISLITGPVATNQSAACWVVLTGNKKYAYTTNTASGTLSLFNTTFNGGLSLSASVAATSQAGPIDAAISNNSRFLYVLNNGAHSISGYAVANDGSLTSVQTLAGINIGANGLAAN
jgi:6-phosphogluconolactonase